MACSASSGRPARAMKNSISTSIKPTMMPRDYPLESAKSHSYRTPPAGFNSKPSLVYVFLQKFARSLWKVRILSRVVGFDIVHHVEPYLIHQLERSMLTADVDLEDAIDIFDGCDTGRDDFKAFAFDGSPDPIEDKTGAFLANQERRYPVFGESPHEQLDYRGIGVAAAPDLDGILIRRHIEMRIHYSFAALGGYVVDEHTGRIGRGVAGEDGVIGSKFLDVAKNRALQIQTFGHRLNRYPAIVERLLESVDPDDAANLPPELLGRVGHFSGDVVDCFSACCLLLVVDANFTALERHHQRNAASQRATADDRRPPVIFARRHSGLSGFQFECFQLMGIN